MSIESPNRPELIAYAVSRSGEKSRFREIGAAWPNTKGGFGLRLFAYPVDGEIVLLPPQEREEAAEG